MKKIIPLLLAALLTGCAEKSIGSAPEIIEDNPAHNETNEEAAGDKSTLSELISLNNAQIARQKSIEREIDFSPIEISEPCRYGNLPQNIKCGIGAGFVCPDADSGAVYFTDLNGSYALSKYENGIVTELVPITASHINLWNGSLYYIGRSDGQTGVERPWGAVFGSIFRYDISTGENTVLLETNAVSLIVSEHGIDFTAGEVYSDDSTLCPDERQYHMDFDGTISENGEYPLTDRCLGLWYGENSLIAQDGALCFSDSDGGFNAALSRKSVNCLLTIYEDWLCCRPSLSEIYCLNLRTGESLTYTFSFLQDYIWLGDTLYATSGTHIAACKNGETKDYPISQPPSGTMSFDKLLTDGESIIGVSSVACRLYRLSPNEYGTAYIYEPYPGGGKS